MARANAGWMVNAASRIQRHAACIPLESSGADAGSLPNQDAIPACAGRAQGGRSGKRYEQGVIEGQTKTPVCRSVSRPHRAAPRGVAAFDQRCMMQLDPRHEDPPISGQQRQWPLFIGRPPGPRGGRYVRTCPDERHDAQATPSKLRRCRYSNAEPGDNRCDRNDF